MMNVRDVEVGFVVEKLEEEEIYIITIFFLIFRLKMRWFVENMVHGKPAFVPAKSLEDILGTLDL